MEKEEVPDPRFASFDEIFNKSGVAIGFTIQGSDHIFKYDEKKGWYDEYGNYFNSDGVKIKSVDVQPEEQDEDQDDELVDEFQKILEQQQRGYQKKTQKKPEQNKPQKKIEINFQDQIQKLLERYKQGKEIREKLPKQLLIYFKMNKDQFEKVQHLVEKAKSTLQQNKIVETINVKIQENKKQLIQRNKFLGLPQTFLDFSGTQDDDDNFKRYWYGSIKAGPDNYLELWKQIQSSKEFHILKFKSYFALESKFFKKPKMIETVANLEKQFEDLPKQRIVQVILNNLPELFPASLILDYCEFVGLDYTNLLSLFIKDDFTAYLKVTAEHAKKLMNLEGYQHGDKEFIWLEISDTKQDFDSQKNYFDIKIDKTRSDKKLFIRQLYDTLAIPSSRQGILKIYKEVSDDNQIAIGPNYLRRLLMYRGQSIDTIRAVRVYQKKEITA